MNFVATNSQRILSSLFLRHQLLVSSSTKPTSNFVVLQRAMMASFTSRELSNFVGGKRVQPQQPSHTFDVFNPATEEVYSQCKSSSASDVSEAVASSKQAFQNWSKMSGFERGKILRKTAEIIRDNLEAIARLEVHDNGKPIWEARVDIEGCADTFDYYGGLATTANTGENLPLNGGKSFALTRREPLGVIGGIGAWNYPFQTASWKIAPALACGNTFIYKPSPLTPLTALNLAEIMIQAGAEPGVLNIVQGEALTGESLCVHPDVRKISFTGSVPTGQRIMQACASKGGLKPVTLELGGKSPLIIFEDADVVDAVSGAMMANFYTQGEVCSNASRVFVHESLMDEVQTALIERIKKLKIGNPLDEGVYVGATISPDHMEKVKGYIQSGVEEGAKIVYGGEECKVNGKGYFLSPCLMSGVSDSMRIVREEIFGSVLLLMPFSDESDVVRRANNTPFGLSAGLFTKDLKRAHRVSAQLEAGTIYVNAYNITPVEVPFGGYKMSGFGRECGTAALSHYTQVKSVYFHMEDEPLDSGFP